MEVLSARRRIIHGCLTWTTEFIDEVVAEFDKGISTKKIGEMFGITKNSVVGIITRARKQGKVARENVMHDPNKPKKKRVRVKVTRENKLDPRTVSLARIIEEYKNKPKHRIRLRMVEKENVTLMQLKTGMCKWPIGDPRLPDFCYCGRTKSEETKWPYCEEHHQIARALNQRRSRGYYR